MTHDEYITFMAGFPKRWEFSRHEIETLWQVARDVTVAEARDRIHAFLGQYEGRFKPKIKQMCFVLRHKVPTGEFTPSGVVESTEPDLPTAQSDAAWAFYRRLMAAKTARDRLVAVKWYYDKRDAMKAPVEGGEYENIELLKARYQTEIMESRRQKAQVTGGA